MKQEITAVYCMLSNVTPPSFALDLVTRLLGVGRAVRARLDRGAGAFAAGTGTTTPVATLRLLPGGVLEAARPSVLAERRRFLPSLLSDRVLRPRGGVAALYNSSALLPGERRRRL